MFHHQRNQSRSADFSHKGATEKDDAQVCNRTDSRNPDPRRRHGHGDAPDRDSGWRPSGRDACQGARGRRTDDNFRTAAGDDAHDNDVNVREGNPGDHRPDNRPRNDAGRDTARSHAADKRSFREHACGRCNAGHRTRKAANHDRTGKDDSAGSDDAPTGRGHQTDKRLERPCSRLSGPLQVLRSAHRFLCAQLRPHHALHPLGAKG